MFNLSTQIDEQVEAHLNLLRRKGWLTFKGPAAIELLRKVILVNPQPHLIAHCHYNLAAPPLDYEFFSPERVEVLKRPKVVKITGRLRGREGVPQTLFWHPDRPADTSGTFLSSISTLASCFPEKAISGITLPPLDL